MENCNDKKLIDFKNFLKELESTTLTTGEVADQIIKSAIKAYKDYVLDSIQEMRNITNTKDFGERFIRIMNMLFDLPVKNITISDSNDKPEGKKLFLHILVKKDGTMSFSAPIATEKGELDNRGANNYKYLLANFGPMQKQYLLANVDPMQNRALLLMTQDLHSIMSDTYVDNEEVYNEFLKKGLKPDDAKSLAKKFSGLIASMQEIRNIVLRCKYFLSKNKKQKKKNKLELEKQKKNNEKRNEALNQLLRKNDKKIEQECQSNYFRKWKDNVRKEKLATYDWKKFAECIANIKDRNKQQELIKAKQGSNKAFYKLQNNAVLLKKQDEFTEKLTKTKNTLKTSVLKGIVKNKINSEKNIMSKTIHNWHSNTLKQKNEELKQLANKKKKEIESLKLQNEQKMTKTIEQCNKEAKHLLSEYAQNMGKQISKYINTDLIPKYNYYTNYYKTQCDQKAAKYYELENKYTDLLQKNNELETKIKQLSHPELNINAKPFLPKNKPMNDNMQFNNNNHINDNNLNTMNYFYQNQAFGRFGNGKK